MTSQESATIMLLDHQSSREARMRLAGIRENDLAQYYASQRRAGSCPIEANELTASHAKFLDGELERDLSIIRACMERTS